MLDPDVRVFKGFLAVLGGSLGVTLSRLGGLRAGLELAGD